MTKERRRLGALGESVAAWYLRTQGMTVLARNVEVPGGEIDMLARDGSTRVAVEVRSVRGGADPIEAVGAAKRSRVARLALRAGAQRVDLIGVRIGTDGVDIHWVPGDG